MKISRVLQRDKLNIEGLAPIRLKVSWEGKHLRICTGGLLARVKQERMEPCHACH